MKFSNYLVAGAILILFFSCSDNIESSYLENESDLKIEIPIQTASIEVIKSEKSTSVADYSFSGEGIFSAASLDIFNYQKIKPGNKPLLKIPATIDGGEFSLLHLEWGYKTSGGSDYTMQSTIDLLTFEITRDEGLYKINLAEALDQLVYSLDSNHTNSFKIKITGISNFAITGNAELEIPVLMKTEVVSPRFELF